jgi:hypothetical protein
VKFARGRVRLRRKEKAESRLKKGGTVIEKTRGDVVAYAKELEQRLAKLEARQVGRPELSLPATALLQGRDSYAIHTTP